MMEFIIKHFADMEFKHRNNLRMVTRILTSWFKFDKYYKLTDNTAVYAASILLHPGYFSRSLRITRRSTVRAVRKVWRKYFKPDSSATLVVDIRRRRFELTSSSTVVEESYRYLILKHLDFTPF